MLVWWVCMCRIGRKKIAHQRKKCTNNWLNLSNALNNTRYAFYFFLLVLAITTAAAAAAAIAVFVYQCRKCIDFCLDIIFFAILCIAIWLFSFALAKLVLAHSKCFFFISFRSLCFYMIKYETHMAPCRPNYCRWVRERESERDRERDEKNTYTHLTLSWNDCIFSVCSIISFCTVTLKLPFKPIDNVSMQDEDGKKSDIFFRIWCFFFLIRSACLRWSTSMFYTS